MNENTNISLADLIAAYKYSLKQFSYYEKALERNKSSDKAFAQLQPLVNKWQDRGAELKSLIEQRITFITSIE